MSQLESHFKPKDYNLATSNPDAIIKGEKYRITILSDILVRLEWSDTGTFEDRPTELVEFRHFPVPRFIKKEDNNFVSISTKYFKLDYHKNSPFIGTKLSPDQYLKITLVGTDHIWSFGAAEARNFKGSGISLDNSEGNVNYTKGLYSTDGFVSLDDSNTLIYNEDGSLGKRSDKRIDTYVFLYRKDFGFCLRDYYKLTGKPALIPRYALGVWWNKNTKYTTSDIESLVWNFHHHELPISVLLLSKSWHIPYDKTYSGFTFNYELIESPNKMIQYLHNNSIHLGLNIDPTGGISPDEIAYNRFKTASGYNEEGIIPFNVFNKDLLNAYLNELIKPLIDLGTDFFWIDYQKKNDYYTLRALNHYHFINNNKYNKRGMILSRNGLVASHKYPILYSGETIVSWKLLDLLPEFNSKSSNLGISWWSHDIGGYKGGMEDPELYMRFIQLGTYSPILRLASDESHYYKREPWLWDVKTFSVVKEYLNLRHRLIPYIYTESYKYHRTGLPLIQPIYYKYPEIYDEPLYKNEYYFGTELFIAPITTKKNALMNRTVHRIFLPNGVWYDFKTGKKFIGGKRYITFYKDEDYPVFAKKGTIIPMAVLEDDNLNLTSSPKKMEIHIFPGISNTYKLYEDDGFTNDYLNGEYLLSDIDYNYQQNNFTTIIRPVEGKTNIIPNFRSYIVRFRNVRKPSEVIVYIGEDPEYKFNSYIDGNDFVVEIENVKSSKQISINCKGKDIEIEAERIINEDIDSIVSDLQISTELKEEIASVLFSSDEIRQKRINIKKLRRKGLNPKYITMFISLLEYIAEL